MTTEFQSENFARIETSGHKDWLKGKEENNPKTIAEF
jgi:hypothetical protein